MLLLAHLSRAKFRENVTYTSIPFWFLKSTYKVDVLFGYTLLFNNRQNIFDLYILVKGV